MADSKKNATSDSPTDDYEVGYGKPPKHTQFKPGQSGNPRGRPKGTKNLKTDLLEELGEQVVVREGDRSQLVSKQRAVVKSIVARTLNGDTRAASILTSMIFRLTDTGEGAPDHEDVLIEDEMAILKQFEVRTRRRDRHGGDRRSDAGDESEALS